MKWVTKNNVGIWIFFGIVLLIFGITMGSIQHKNQNKKKKKQKIESLTTNTDLPPRYADVMTKLFNFLKQTYSDSEKISMIKQIDVLTNNQDSTYDTYNYVMNDTKMTDSEKIEAIKQRFALNYAIPTTFSSDPIDCMNTYLVPLQFTDPKIITILGDTRINQYVSEKINKLQSYIKENNI